MSHIGLMGEQDELIAKGDDCLYRTLGPGLFRQDSGVGDKQPHGARAMMVLVVGLRVVGEFRLASTRLGSMS